MCIEFETLYNKNIKTILQSIENNSELKFEVQYIPIYINLMRRPSFSRPLTLRVQENKQMFVTLIHELVHNLCFNLKFASKQETEDYINDLTIKVINTLKQDFSKEIQVMIERSKA